MELKPLTTLLLITLIGLIHVQLIHAGCRYDDSVGEYTCGQHGKCKEKKISDTLTHRYCRCRPGYTGTETCDTQCDDCCEQLEQQCFYRKVPSLCAVPRCLRKALRSRHCPKDSTRRKSMEAKMRSYYQFCQLKTVEDTQ